LRLGAKPIQVRVPSPPLKDILPVRSTGACYALEGYETLLPALATCDLIVDVTVEGMLHSKELQTLITQGARLLMISNEHPEILERCMPDPLLKPKIDKSLELLSRADVMTVTSLSGTKLSAEVKGAPSRGGAGLANTVNGTVVLESGDVNLTFKRYFESRVTLHIENDFVTSIEGKGLDADLMRVYYEGWADPNAYAISHLGWGLNPRARWEALMMYDKRQVNGTELRALAGSFLISTGANEFSNRYTRCHFDLPMRNCSIKLDDLEIIKEGRLVGELS
jgi:2,5-dihydroxypyridine 5,6-dioxygenase